MVSGNLLRAASHVHVPKPMSFFKKFFKFEEAKASMPIREYPIHRSGMFRLT